MIEQEKLLLKAKESLQAPQISESNGLVTVSASRVYYSMFYVA